MIARTPTWIAGEDWRDVARWPVAAGAVLCVHAALIALYLVWREPVETAGDDAPTIAIDLIAPEIDQFAILRIQLSIPRGSPPKMTGRMIVSSGFGEQASKDVFPDRAERARRARSARGQYLGGSLPAEDLKEQMRQPPAAPAEGKMWAPITAGGAAISRILGACRVLVAPRDLH